MPDPDQLEHVAQTLDVSKLSKLSTCPGRTAKLPKRGGAAEYMPSRLLLSFLAYV